jgi:UDP-2,3-diacylglucosamine pyrophosphatase LpxH
MLVIISDLHLSDGSTGKSIPDGAFKEFRATLESMAESASWRAPNNYEPINRIDLLLLGDIFDMIRSTIWHGVYITEEGLNPTGVRPWQDVKLYQPIIDKIVDRIIAHNSDSLAILRTLAVSGVSVRRAPQMNEWVNVKVHIHYVVGNHDWMTSVNDSAMDGVRKKIIVACGLTPLTHSENKAFCHDTDASGFAEELKDVLSRHRVFARHGDRWDETNFEVEKSSRQCSSLGDAFVIDLLCKFQVDVARDADLKKSKNYAEIVDGLREMDNVRPSTKTPAWLSSFLQDYPEEQESVMSIWGRLCRLFLDDEFVHSHHNRFSFRDAYERIHLSLELSQLPLWLTRKRVVEWAAELADSSQQFLRGAILDAQQNAYAKFIVYGHTHQPIIIPLFADAQSSKGKMYLNIGTWRPVHEEAVGDPEKFEFVSWKIMTYAAFYLDGDKPERCGRSFETWTGTLETPD